MKRLALGSVVALAILLMVPNIAFVYASPHEKDLSWLAGSLIAPAGLLLGYFAVLGRWPRLACLLMAPFAALVPTVVLYTLRYRTPVTEPVLGTVATTNPAEAADFLGPWMWVLLFVSLVAGAVAVFAGWLGGRARLQFVRSRRVHAMLAAFAAVFVVAFGALAVSVQNRPPTDGPSRDGDNSARVLRVVQDSYPFGLPVTFDAWWTDRARLRAAVAKIRNFRFHASRASLAGRRQIYVLVIGESSRLNHWQLFGYGRPTNPELSHDEHLIRVTDMVSPWPMSMGGVPALLTRKPPRMALTDTFEESSIVGLMGEAGFDTWWISNQSPAGEWNSPITVYAKEAHHVEWLNLQRYDGSLPDSLAKAVHGSSGDLFVVLHMMGSHGSYDRRYPPAFKYFRPTVEDGKRFDTNYRHVVNSYDNTIRYTDHVLGSIIGILKNTGAVTAMWYQSDHGETLPTATCSAVEHGHGFRYEFPVPAIFWYSDAYAHAFPEKIAALEDNAGKRTISSDTFATLADMAGVDFPGHDRSRSLFSRSWHYQPRFVHPVWQDGNSLVNYDRADLGNGCELVRAQRHG